MAKSAIDYLLGFHPAVAGVEIPFPVAQDMVRRGWIEWAHAGFGAREAACYAITPNGQMAARRIAKEITR